MGRRRYQVQVAMTKTVQIGVWAEDESEAEEKAEEIVAAWDGVTAAEATDVEEE